MRKSYNTEEIRKQIDARIKPVVRGGKVCLLNVDENGELLNHNEVTSKEEYLKIYNKK